MEPPTSRFLALPTEIIEAVLLALRPSLSSLDAVSRVCRRLNALSIPLLYRSVIIRSPRHGEKFARTVSGCPNLIPLVRELQIHYHETKDDECPEELDPVIAQLVNLESLVIRSDWFDFRASQQTSLICRPQDILPNLRSCNLGYDYSDETNWILHPYEALFHHPGLRTLSITRANVQTRWNYLPTPKAAPRSTQLEELQLLNCDISWFRLREMLQYPRALKHFTLKGEAPTSDFHGALDNEDRSQCIDALQTHSSSLETLDLDLYTDWEEPMDLSGFTVLKRLTISPRMLLGDDPEGGPRTAPVPRGKDILPSSLEHLTFRNHEAIFPLFGVYETVRNGDLPHLRHFTCEMLADPPDGYVSRRPENILADECTDGMSYALAFDKLGVHLSVVEVTDPSELPENKTAPCQCWIYRHRMSSCAW